MYNPPLEAWILALASLIFMFYFIHKVVKRHQPSPKLFRESNRFHLCMKWYGMSEAEAFTEFAKITSLEALKTRNDEMEKEIRLRTKDYQNHLSKKVKNAKRYRTNNKSR